MPSCLTSLHRRWRNGNGAPPPPPSSIAFSSSSSLPPVVVVVVGVAVAVPRPAVSPPGPDRGAGDRRPAEELSASFSRHLQKPEMETPHRPRTGSGRWPGFQRIGSKRDGAFF